MSREFHPFAAVVELAVVPLEDGQPPPVLPQRGAPLADRARAATARMGRSSLEVRDALWACLDAIAGLERTVDWLQTRLVLQGLGIELTPEMVLVAADGLELQRTGPWADGQDVLVYLALDVRDVRHLLPLRATIEQRPEGAYAAFRDVRDDQRDLIVAFVFQQEAKERRRALDTPG